MISSEFIGICAIGIAVIGSILGFVYKLGKIEGKIEMMEKDIQKFAQWEGYLLILQQLIQEKYRGG
ncbi:MAG: hypothetical protein COS08_08065 [Euryarchaeota archaeon CG01_land_8_20_14_3_00_38_12]|nr:MAG: hypothetical protein COS08_08065 [Euryarchaeota archaeon CG01_land_8_20_14_3_00_38_12]PJB21565.1 MAG: hypothetical protein CO114_04680 [Euryarchaeota archaeon CG_4_9_14_3_um_filter_38_12]